MYICPCNTRRCQSQLIFIIPPAHMQWIPPSLYVLVPTMAERYLKAIYICNRIVKKPEQDIDPAKIISYKHILQLIFRCRRVIMQLILMQKQYVLPYWYQYTCTDWCSCILLLKYMGIQCLYIYVYRCIYVHVCV